MTETVKKPWQKFSLKGKNMQRRTYEDYNDYVHHQKGKLEKGIDWLQKYDEEYFGALVKRLREQDIVKQGMSVLCLGARIGTEVKSFLSLGCFAVGIDLNPGENSKYVLHGDFHDIQFPSKSVDVVFTNSLDHAYNLHNLLSEIRRVLKPDGHLILEVVKGSEEGVKPKEYESLFWEKTNDIIEFFTESSFKLIKRINIEYPWEGEHVVLRHTQ